MPGIHTVELNSGVYQVLVSDARTGPSAVGSTRALIFQGAEWGSERSGNSSKNIRG